MVMSAFDRRLHHEGRSVDVSIPQGEVRWLDAQEHSGENVGTTDTIGVFIDLKEQAPDAAREHGQLGPRL